MPNRQEQSGQRVEGAGGVDVMAKFDPFVVIAASIKINVKLRLQPSKIGIGNVTIQQSVNQLRAFAKTS